MPRSRRENTVAAVVVAVVLLSLLVAYAYELGAFSATHKSPQVLIPNNGTYPGTSEGESARSEFPAQFAGTLEGGFMASVGQVEVCVTTYPFSPWTGPPPVDHCPSNASYSSGYVHSGHIAVAVPGGALWMTVYAPIPPRGTDEPFWNVTWSPALEIVPT